MWISNNWPALAVLLALSVTASADGIVNPVAGNQLGFDGINNATTGGAPPAGCNGVIDLSAGCPLPMLGVM